MPWGASIWQPIWIAVLIGVTAFTFDSADLGGRRRLGRVDLSWVGPGLPDNCHPCGPRALQIRLGHEGFSVRPPGDGPAICIPPDGQPATIAVCELMERQLRNQARDQSTVLIPPAAVGPDYHALERVVQAMKIPGRESVELLVENGATLEAVMRTVDLLLSLQLPVIKIKEPGAPQVPLSIWVDYSCAFCEG